MIRADTLSDLARIGDELKATSPADTVAWAFGLGAEVVESADDSGGRFFDLASLTKPLFTAPAVLGLVSGPAELEQSVAGRLDWVPDSPGTPTLRGLLTHTAGLPDELPVDRDASTVRAWFAERVRELPDGPHRVAYSDPGYWLLGRWAEAVAGEPLHTLFERSALASAGGFLFGAAPADRTVPAGPVDSGLRLTHDPAARTLGPSGHAGAFGTLAAVTAAVAAWLGGAGLDDDLAREAVACQTHTIPGGHRSLAWTLGGDPYHAVAHDWPPTTVCHSGFTGVSVALDPVSGWWAIYLSNAIPVDRDATPILIARRRFHAIAAARLRELATGLSTTRGE